MARTLPLSRSAALALVCSASAVAPASAGVIVVDAAGGAAFTQIQPAVDAALGGDTILVRPGAYTSFTIDGKSLAVVADAGGAVQVSGRVEVRNLSASQRVVLSGISAAVPLSFNQPGSLAGLHVTGNAGAVRVHGGTFAGQSYTTWGYLGQPGAQVASNAAVAFVGCTLVGGRGADQLDWSGFHYDGGSGLDLRDAQVALYDCTLTGGRGGDGFDGCGNGGHGARVRTSTSATGLFASNTQFRGGRGGDDWEDVFAELTEPGDGGHGLYLESGTAAQLLDNTYQGGAPGVGINCIPPVPPSPGSGVFGPGTAFYFNVEHLALGTPAVVREGAPLALTIRGQPGDEAYLLIARTTGFEVIPSWRGVVIPTLATPSRSLILGTIPASGELGVSITVPDLGPGVSARDAFLQAWRRDGTGTITLGSFAAVAVLDSAY